MPRTPKTLTTLEAEKLLDALTSTTNRYEAKRKGLRNHLIGLLFLDAGLRVGELVQLRFSDLFFKDEPVMSLRIRPEIAKRKRERIIPLSKRIRLAIEKHQRHNYHEYVKDNDPFAFTISSSLTALTKRQVQRIIKTAGEKAINRPVNPHMLRHTFATKMMRVTSVRVVQELLGHANMQTTQIYTHPNGDDLQKAIDSME